MPKRKKGTAISQAARGADGRFVAAVEAIYEAAPEPERWPHALQKIGDCFEDVGAVMVWRRDDGGFGTIASPSLAAAQRDYQENRWDLQDISAHRVVERALWLHGDAWTNRHVVSDEEMNTHPFYTDFSAKHGLHWRASVGVAPDPRILVAISIQRSGHRPPYSDAELDVATRLGRHVEKSLRLSMRLFDAELANLGLGEALMRLGIGVFALDALGRVVFSNPAGERLLGRRSEIVAGRLHLGSGTQRAAIDAAITQVLRGMPVDLLADPKPILLNRTPPDRPLAVYLLPIAPRQKLAEHFLTHTRLIVLVIEPKANQADPAVVRDVLGITLGEARVAALIGAGLPPREASEQLGISEESARTVLKRVYGKVGVSRQSELAALLSRLAIAPGRQPIAHTPDGD